MKEYNDGRAYERMSRMYYKYYRINKYGMKEVISSNLEKVKGYQRYNTGGIRK